MPLLINRGFIMSNNEKSIINKDDWPNVIGGDGECIGGGSSNGEMTGP